MGGDGKGQGTPLQADTDVVPDYIEEVRSPGLCGTWKKSSSVQPSAFSSAASVYKSSSGRTPVLDGVKLTHSLSV